VTKEVTTTGEDSETKTETNHGIKNGTTLQYKCCSELSQKFKLGNSDFNYEIAYKPKNFNNEDKSLQLKHVS